MSEVKNNQFINSENMSICLQMMSNDYSKVQHDLSNSKLEIISLEKQLVSEKELNTIYERKYQRCLQDLEHFKIKKVFEKPIYNVNEHDQIDIDVQSVFKQNESLIKNNFDLTQKFNDLEIQFAALTNKYKDLELELCNSRERNTDLYSFNEEMKVFVNEKKSQLMELNTLKYRINELEDTNKTDGSSLFISLNINKMKDLELKCFNLEKLNGKLKENHANLMLLGEENASLTNENERLKQRLLEYEDLNTTKQSDRSFESNYDVSTERHSRHIERENQILKCQQAEISEQNAELKSKIAVLERQIKYWSLENEDYQMLLHDKEQRIIMKDKEIRCLTKDCQSFKQVLATFTDQCSVESNSETMSARLQSICHVLDEHRSELDQQTVVLDQLVQVIASHVESLENNSATVDSIADSDTNTDRRMVMELRKEMERLNQDLEEKISELKEADERYRNIVKEYRIAQRLDESDDQMSETSFSECGGLINRKDRNKKILKALNRGMLETVKQVLGYSLELGPNGHVTCHNCLSDDPSEVLEFKVTVPSTDHDVSGSPTLIENVYSQTIRKQIDFKNHYPALLASITLDLLERNDNAMCCL